MARGIEELAEMQVTGPVQGGDMVMKPGQTPVGAAALLNKMSRQNTPGIFKLPMPDKQMPDFMKVAAEGVEQQTAKGDSINQMAGELLRQGINIRGMGMDEIIQIYEQTFGSPRDVDEFGVSKVDPSDWRTILRILEAGGDPGTETAKVDPSDWRTILQMINSGMSEEQIQEQMAMNTMKDRAHKDAAKVEAFAPEGHQLAYITPDEQEVLKMMGGSGETNPMTGIKQYPEISQTQAEEKYGVTPQQWSQGFSSGEKVTGGGVQDQPSIAAAIANIDAQKSYQDTQNIYDQLSQEHTPEAINVSRKTGVELPETPEKKGFAQVMDMFNPLSGMMGMTDKFSEFLTNRKIGNVKDFIKDDKSAAGWANLMDRFGRADDPEKAFQSWLNDHEGAWKDTLLTEMEGEEDKTRTSYDEVLNFMKERHGDSDQWKKHFSKDKAKWWKDNPARTGDSAESMVRNLTMKDISNSGLSGADKRRLSYDLQMARDEINKKDDNRGQRGGGGPVEQITEEEEVVTTPIDERAGAFNVGGTMPYTEDIRTAGVEMDVPLGRRFQTDKEGKYRGSTGMDLSEAMKYATLGGYGQLEPFQEYLTRRRDYLGEEEPRYFDEEGNVIYSDTETA